MTRHVWFLSVSALLLTACGRKAIEEGTCTDDDDANFALCIQAGCSAYKSTDATGMDSCDGAIDILAQAGSGSCSFSGSGSCEVICDCGDGDFGGGDEGAGSTGGSSGGSTGSGSSGGSTVDMCDAVCSDLWPCIWGDAHATVDCSTCDGWSDALVECLYDCGTSCDCAESDCGMTVLGG